MIAGATRGTGGGALARHLLSQAKGQTVRVMEPRHLVAADLRAQLRELVDTAKRGRTDRPVYHVHIDPPPGSDAATVTEKFVTLFEREFGLEDVPRLGVQHVKNGRAHYHIVYSLVRPDGRVASLSHEYARREKISRVTEFECGLPWTQGKHNRAVAQALRKDGRVDVADAMEAVGLLDGRRPAAPQTPGERAQAERTGIPVADVRSALLSAWQSSDDGPSFSAAIQQHGLRLAQGEKALVVIDRAGGPHALARHLSAAARDAGSRIVAADIKRRVGDMPIPTVEEANERTPIRNPPPEAEQGRLHGNPERVPRGSRDEPETLATSEPSRNPGWPGGPIGRTQGAVGYDHHDPRPSLRIAGRAQVRHRAAQHIAAARLGGLEVSALQTKADAVRLRPMRRAVRDLAAAHHLAALDLADLHDRAGCLAAGSILRHSEVTTSTKEEPMKGIRARPAPTAHPRCVQDYKRRLLTEVLPDVDVGPWEADVYQIRKGGPSVSARIQMHDKSWLEIDERRQVVRTWGRPGRASDLAEAIAKGRGWTVEHQRPGASIGAPADRPPPRQSAATLEAWWRERGYDAIAARDGIWVEVGGGSQLQDTGSRVTVHGGLTDEAARAIIVKVAEMWGGAGELEGAWSGADQDRLWLEAQRAGVTIGRCTPSAQARKAWEAEAAEATQREATLVQVRAATGAAQDLKDAAAGDGAALARLDPELRAFVTGFLDDTQRRELVNNRVEDIIPELARFRDLGSEERQRQINEPGAAPKPKNPDLTEVAPAPPFRVPG